jgi:protein involved in polysaccharide export with SLBB domain
MRNVDMTITQKLIFILVFVTGLVLTATAQEKSKSRSLDDIDLMSTEKTSAASVQMPPAGVALESPVNPETYFVGPSDVIAVNIWMSPPVNYPLTVTPEGTLIIPTVGELKVTGMTLAKAKELIIREARKKYLSVDISATLVRPRPLVVSVSGTVLNPGLFTLSAVDRVNKAVDEANKPTRLQTSDDQGWMRILMSTRNIALRHRDGTTDRVDIPKYLATHEERWNPFLREGDVVIVPSRDRYKNVIGVYGQVNSPGRFEFVPGDRILDALQLAQGLTPLAIPEHAIFSRLNEDGTVMENHAINLNDVIAGKGENTELRSGDRIVVQGSSDLREDYNVDVKGEVKYPATYPITRNRTKLSEIIREAGGFTDYASLRTATIIRRSIKQEDVYDEQIMSARGGIATADSAGFTLETELRMKHETVTVDFEKLFQQGDSTQDILLQPEDQIIVPSRTQSIYVFGQVSSPGHIPYIAGKDPDYYVKKAGDFTDRANKGGLKVIKAKTKQWVSPGDTKVEEGDYIWIPTEPDRPFGYYMNIASQAAAVVSVILGIAVVIVQVSK